MAGAYCKFCGQRCFVLRVIPDGPKMGWSGHLATCQGGMAHDLKKTGHTHLTAVNPVTEPEAAAAIPVMLSNSCACECNDWERRPGTDGQLVACRSCGTIGLVVEAPGTTSVHRVTLNLCSLCITGAGGECHTPGCSFWMCSAPSRSIALSPEPAPKEG